MVCFCFNLMSKPPKRIIRRKYNKILQVVQFYNDSINGQPVKITPIKQNSAIDTTKWINRKGVKSVEPANKEVENKIQKQFLYKQQGK